MGRAEMGADELMVSQEEEQGASPDAPCTTFAKAWNSSVRAALQDATLLAELRLLCDKGVLLFSARVSSITSKLTKTESVLHNSLS